MSNKVSYHRNDSVSSANNVRGKTLLIACLDCIYCTYSISSVVFDFLITSVIKKISLGQMLVPCTLFNT